MGKLWLKRKPTTNTFSAPKIHRMKTNSYKKFLKTLSFVGLYDFICGLLFNVYILNKKVVLDARRTFTVNVIKEKSTNTEIYPLFT